jgi:glycosyltransferase involved in cell wall biosynthesis
VTSKIRLAIVSDAVLPWHVGGKESQYQQIISRAREFDIEVTVYTMHWWKSEDRRRTIIRDGIRYVAILPVISMYRGEKRSITQALLFALSCAQLIFSRVDVIEADQIPHLQLFVLGAISRVRRLPLVATWHECWGRDYWVSYLGAKGNIAAVIEWLTSRIPNLLFAVSSETHDRLIRSGVPNSRVVLRPNTIDVDGILSTPRFTSNVDVLTVGRLIQHKRIDLVIRAMAVTPELSQATLTIIGEGPERENLEKQGAELGVASRLRFTGEIIDQIDVWAYMKAARVICAPSEREGFGLAVAESLAAGTPVITVSAPHNASQELINHEVNGSIIPPNDAEALGCEIVRWLQSPKPHYISENFLATQSGAGWHVFAQAYFERLKVLVAS